MHSLTKLAESAAKTLASHDRSPLFNVVFLSNVAEASSRSLVNGARRFAENLQSMLIDASVQTLFGGARFFVGDASHIRRLPLKSLHYAH